MAYFWFKAFHIIGVVVWFAGLFYLVRLFVYHIEADEQPEPTRSILKNQYQIMEKRLSNIITTPGMLVTVLMAIGLLTTEPDVLKDTWLHLKLTLVALLLVYHFYCNYVLRQLANCTFTWSSQQLRAFNEVPTVLLVMIVLLATFKDNLPLGNVILLIIGMGITFALSIWIYARNRNRKKTKVDKSQSNISMD